MLFDLKTQQALVARRRKGLERENRIFTRLADNHIGINEQLKYVNFSSNDYLGLANDSELISAWQQGLSQYGCGSSASPAVTGLSKAHENLQAQLCEWLGYSKAILFNSGFSANQALLFTLLDKTDHLLQDKLNHASLIEAGLLCPATMLRFKHNNIDDLSRKLAMIDSASAKLVVTEGVFSMDGDIAPLDRLSHQCQQHNAWFAVDDAHGFGVLGASGAGTTELMGMKPTILIVTFGKAAGLAGAAVLCDDNMGEFLTQFARHYVYSTAMPPAQAHAIGYAISMMQEQDWRREKLTELDSLFSQRLSGLVGHTDTNTAIKPWICGGSQQAIELSQYLKNRGLWVGAIRPPTVPANSARLRITLNASHTTAQVSNLSQAIYEYYQLDDNASRKC